jgi:hypothetical protein
MRMRMRRRGGERWLRPEDLYRTKLLSLFIGYQAWRPGDGYEDRMAVAQFRLCVLHQFWGSYQDRFVHIIKRHQFCQ